MFLAQGPRIALQAQSPVSTGVKQSIFVAPIGDNEVGKIIREKLVAYLSSHFTILDSEDEADLILTGSNVTTVSQHYDSAGNLHTSFHITAIARLVDRDSRVLWSKSVTNAVFAHSATSDVAKKIAQAFEAEHGDGR